MGTIIFSQMAYAETDQELLASGQWRDPKTGLIWMRCSVGQTWTGSTCMGTPTKITGFSAHSFTASLKHGKGFAGHKDWRLPTPYELSTIRVCSAGWQRKISHSAANVDGRVTEVQGDIDLEPLSYSGSGNLYVPKKCVDNSKAPTLNTKIFPNSPAFAWWTNEEWKTYEVWSVSFRNGVIYTQGGNFIGDGHMRLVRK